MEDPFSLQLLQIFLNPPTYVDSQKILEKLKDTVGTIETKIPTEYFFPRG